MYISFLLFQKLTKLNSDITTVALKLFWPFVLSSVAGKPLRRIWALFSEAMRRSAIKVVVVYTPKAFAPLSSSLFDQKDVFLFFLLD